MKRGFGVPSSYHVHEPITMDDTTRKYRELTCGEILTQRERSFRNGGGGGRKDGDGAYDDGREDGDDDGLVYSGGGVFFGNDSV